MFILEGHNIAMELFLVRDNNDPEGGLIRKQIAEETLFDDAQAADENKMYDMLYDVYVVWSGDVKANEESCKEVLFWRFFNSFKMLKPAMRSLIYDNKYKYVTPTCVELLSAVKKFSGAIASKKNRTLMDEYMFDFFLVNEERKMEANLQNGKQ